MTHKLGGALKKQMRCFEDQRVTMQRPGFKAFGCRLVWIFSVYFTLDIVTMRLASFTVKNFRSITDAYKLPLRDFAVLVGPNNEGKSNVLKSIVLALGLLSRSRYYKSQRQLRYRYGAEEDLAFSWNRDYPLTLQATQLDGRSEFVLEFELNTAEQREFRTRTKLNLSTNLKLKLSLGREDAKLDLLLQGQAKQKVGPDLEEVARFVAERLDIQYIPAIRPSALAESVVDDLLARELALLEANAEYQELLGKLEAIQQPVLDALSSELTKTVSGFIPEVSAVSVQTGNALRRAVSIRPVFSLMTGQKQISDEKGMASRASQQLLFFVIPVKKHAVTDPLSSQ